jgi:hypothetical protein
MSERGPVTETANDAVSRLLSLDVAPRTLASMLRVDRDDVANWALALAPVPDALTAPIAGLAHLLESGPRPDLEDLAWALRRLPDEAWRRALADWPAAVKALGNDVSRAA